MDEEVGMPGAIGLDGSDLKSRYLLNIDSEVEKVLTVGCAGGTACHIKETAEDRALPGNGMHPESGRPQRRPFRTAIHMALPMPIT